MVIFGQFWGISFSQGFIGLTKRPIFGQVGPNTISIHTEGTKKLVLGGQAY